VIVLFLAKGDKTCLFVLLVCFALQSLCVLLLGLGKGPKRFLGVSFRFGKTAKRFLGVSFRFLSYVFLAFSHACLFIKKIGNTPRWRGHSLDLTSKGVPPVQPCAYLKR